MQDNVKASCDRQFTEVIPFVLWLEAHEIYEFAVNGNVGTVACCNWWHNNEVTLWREWKHDISIISSCQSISRRLMRSRHIWSVIVGLLNSIEISQVVTKNVSNCYGCRTYNRTCSTRSLVRNKDEPYGAQTLRWRYNPTIHRFWVTCINPWLGYTVTFFFCLCFFKLISFFLFDQISLP